MRPLCLLLLAPAFVLVAPSAAHADTADAGARAMARKLGQEALKLYDAGDYAGALEKLTTANQIVPTPTLGLYAARCLVKLGRIVEASERYLDVTRTRLDRDARPVMQKAMADAAAERDQLLPTIPTLEIVLDGPQGDGVTITVDGKPFLPGLLGEKRPVDPGHHTASVRRGSAEVTQQADVPLGRAARLVLTPPPLTLQAPGASSSAPLRVAGWVGIAVGGAGAVLAGVSGAIALAEEHQLGSSGSCWQYVCNSAESGTVSTYHTVTKLTTVGMVVGVAGLGFGVTALLLTKDGGSTDKSAPAQHDAAASRGVHVEPWVALGAAGLQGSF